MENNHGSNTEEQQKKQKDHMIAETVEDVAFGSGAHEGCLNGCLGDLLLLPFRIIFAPIKWLMRLFND